MVGDAADCRVPDLGDCVSDRRLLPHIMGSSDLEVDLRIDYVWKDDQE